MDDLTETSAVTQQRLNVWQAEGNALAQSALQLATVTANTTEALRLRFREESVSLGATIATLRHSVDIMRGKLQRAQVNKRDNNTKRKTDLVVITGRHQHGDWQGRHRRPPQGAADRRRRGDPPAEPGRPHPLVGRRSGKGGGLILVLRLACGRTHVLLCRSCTRTARPTRGRRPRWRTPGLSPGPAPAWTSSSKRTRALGATAPTG